MPFDGSKYDRGIGGLETQAIELARQLVRVGYRVEAYINNADRGRYDGVCYKLPSDFKGDGDAIIGIDILPNMFFEKRGKWISWIHTPGLGCFHAKMDHVVCNSEWTKELYQESKPANNYVVIPNGFHFGKHINPYLKKSYSIVLAGSVRKGFKRIPEIFKRVRAKLPSATFDVYGGAKLWGQVESEYEYLYGPMREAGINYHGLVSKEILNEVYKTRSVYFSPRCDHIETFGLSVIEAMASGCVPICSKKGNLTNLITENSGVLLEYNENIDEAQVLVDLLTDEAKLTRLRQGAIGSVKKYDWSNVIKLWQSIL